MKKEMPSVFGKDTKKKELVNNLAEIYGRIEREHQISPGDFPNLKRMQVMRVRVPTVGRRHLTSWLPENEGAHRAPGRSQSHKSQSLTANAIAKAGEKQPSCPQRHRAVFDDTEDLT